MKIKDIENFFEELDARVAFPIRVILTGGAAGVLYGIDRATFDIDFEVNLQRPHLERQKWEQLQKSLEEVSRVTKITPQYADDIDRWSTIVLPLKKSRLFKKIGKVEIRILEPDLWAIGKLTRYLSSDTEDIVGVLKKNKIKASECVQTWGRALRHSPPSPMQSVFRRQVEYFLDQYGKTIWGARTNPEKLKEIFKKASMGK